MGLNLTDTILSSRRADTSAVLRRLDRPDQIDRDFLDAVSGWCAIAGVDPVVVIAQWLLETDNARSIRWTRDLNASGMGIVSDGTAQPFHIPDVDASARLFVQCLYALVMRNRHPGISLWRDGETWLTRVWLPKTQSTAMPDVRTVVDLGLRYTDHGDSRATWSWEDGQVPQDTYGRKLVTRLVAFYPLAPDQSNRPVPTPIPSGEARPMALEILDRVISIQNNAPATKLNTGNGRTRPIIHNTSNTSVGADALMHATFVKNGGGSDNVSFHFACDSKRVVQILPLDRIGFHASDGCDNRDTDTGCFDGIAIENCDNADGNIDQTFDNLAELLACIEFGDPSIEYGTKPLSDFSGFIDRTLGHHDVAFDGKWCPEDFLNRYGELGYKPRLKAVAKAKLALKRVTTPGEPDITSDIMPGIDLAIAKRLFGAVKGEDGRTYSYDLNGPVSQLWTERGKAEGIWPKLEAVYSYESAARLYFVFADGSVILSTPDDGPHWLKDAA